MTVFSRYFKSHTLLVEQRIEKDKLPEVVRESDAALRYVWKKRWRKLNEIQEGQTEG